MRRSCARACTSCARRRCRWANSRSRARSSSSSRSRSTADRSIPPLTSCVRASWCSTARPSASPWRRWRASTRKRTRSSRGSICRTACSARSARPRAFAGSPGISTGPTCSPAFACASRGRRRRCRCCSPTATRSPRAPSATAGTMPPGRTPIPSRPTCSRWWPAIWPSGRSASAPARAVTSISRSTPSPPSSIRPPTPWSRSSAPCAGTRTASGSNTTSTSTTSSPSATSISVRWRTRVSTSSTPRRRWRGRTPPPTTTSSTSSGSSPTSTFTTGPVTGSPAATGFS